MPTIWRNRDLLLVLGGGFVNNVGDWVLVVALPAFVFVETGSGLSTAIIVIIELAAGIVLGPYGGSLADRWNLKGTLVWTNLAQALALLPLLAVTADRLWPAFLVAAVQGALQQINDPATFAIVPRVVEEADLIRANSAFGAAGSLSRLIGAPLGGIAVAFGGLELVVVIDGLSFIVAAVAFAGLRTPTPSLASDDDPEAKTGVRDGWNEVKGRPDLVGYVGVHAMAMAAFAMFPVLFIIFVIDILGGDEATIGFVRGMSALGGIVAAVLVGRYLADVTGPRVMMWGYLLFGVVGFTFVNMPEFTTALWVYFALFAATGLPNVASYVGSNTTAQTLCPPALLGRLRGLASSFAAAASLAASVTVALLADHVSVRLLFNVQAGLLLLCGVGTWLFIIRRSEIPSHVPG